MARNQTSARQRGPRRGGGRVTAPKARDVAQSSRYTPPIPREVRVSPTWVPVLMGLLLVVGATMIILNYLELLPGAASNVYLIVGLGLITGGFVAATQWR